MTSSGAQSTLSPAPLVCVIDHLHRDMQIAGDAVEGRFTHAGSTVALGRRPDWISQIGHDKEWRIEWVKLYEGLDLAHAFATTGDRAYLTAWEDLVEEFCDQVAVGHDTSDVSARRLQNWTYAWQRFAAAPAYRGLRNGLAERLVDRIAADALHLAVNLTPGRNHRTMELYALVIVTMAFPHNDPGGERLRGAIEELDRNLRTDIWDDGVHRECSTDYHMIVLRSFLGTIANAQKLGVALPDGFVERVGLACDFALHVQRPDGTTPSFSDGDEGDYRRLLALGADLLGRDDLRWAATGGTAGRPPGGRNVAFPVGGYAVQRSGWGERERAYVDERFCLFDVGPLGDGGHGHYDQLSVEIAADGATLIIDPGRYTYTDEDGQWRHYFKGTAAHNTVMIDGLDQTPYRRSAPKQPSVATLLARSSVDGLDVVVGEVRSVVHDAVHVRDLAFVADDFWIVVDHLRGEQPHRYEARWHLAAGASGQTTLVVDAGGGGGVTAPGLTMVVARGAASVSIEDGWVSPVYGVKLPAPVVVAAVVGHADADIVTLIVPGRRAASVVTEVVDLNGWRGRATIAGIAHEIGWRRDGSGGLAVAVEVAS